MADAQRIHPLDRHMFAANGVTLSLAQNLERFSLRAEEKAVAGLGKAIGLSLPRNPGGVTLKDSLVAFWLGPDEWLVTAREGSGIEDKLSKVKTGHYSVVPVNHRNTAMIIHGPNATNALNSGCPRDLSLEAFPVNSCSRTIIGKAEVVLWRTDKDAFHVECWRSFSDYVWKFLVDAGRSA